MRQRLIAYPLLAVGLAAAWYFAFFTLIQYRRPDVLFVKTPMEVVRAMLELAEVTSDDVVYDLGCGDGRMVLTAAQRGAQGVGIDIDPALVRQCRETAAAEGLSDLVTFRHGDIFFADVRPASVVMLFLLPNLNERLIPQLNAMRPGSRVVSHQWSMPGVKPTRKIEVMSAEDGMKHPVYLFVTPLEQRSD